MDADRQLSRKIFRNASSQMVGRVFVTLCRFLIAVIIVRILGVEEYGKYALIISFLLIGDCLVDFGMTDSLVRLLSRNPEKWGGFFPGFLKAKAFLLISSILLLLGWVWVNAYPEDVRIAGMVGALELIAFAGVLLFRTIFKSLLLMEREVVSELISVIAFIPLLFLAAKSGFGVIAIVGCYVGSRLLFLGLMIFFGRKELGRLKPDLRSGPATPLPAREALVTSAPLGVSALLVVLYMSLDPILLARFVDLESVGLYAGSERFLNLLVLAIYPVADSLFPVLSTYFGRDSQRFQRRMNEAVRAVVILAGGGACVFICGAGFLLGLMGPEMVAATALFQGLAAAYFLRAIASVMGPVIIASGGLRTSMWLTFVAVAVKVVLLFALIPRFGIIGIVYVNVLTEVLNLVLTNSVVRLRVGSFINWFPLLPCLLAALPAVYLVHALGMFHTLFGMFLAGLLYLAFASALGLIPWKDLRALLSRTQPS